MKRFILIFIIVCIYATICKAETKTAIKPSELSISIRNDLKENYSGFRIIEVFKVNNRGVITFEVIIEREKEKYHLYYNDKGNFLYKIIPKSKEKPAPHR